jgi:hypothetical protein
MVPAIVNFLSWQAISQVLAACLPLLDGQNSGEVGYYAGTPKTRWPEFNKKTYLYLLDHVVLH